MSDVQRNEKELVSRRQAAERLVDLAYALTMGGRLELTIEGERVTVPLADELRLERNLRSKADHVELKLELSWSPTDAAVPPGPVGESESSEGSRGGHGSDRASIGSRNPSCAATRSRSSSTSP